METAYLQTGYAIADDEFEELMEKPVSISMSITDEYDNDIYLSKTFKFEGQRGLDEADQILTMVESFLKACEFAYVCDEYDINLVKK